jgi:hypothetical protein
MPSIEELKDEIDGLDINNGSSPFDYFDAYEHFIETLKTSTNGDKPRLRNILATFREKLTNADLVQFDSIRRKAKKLDEALIASSVGDLVTAINDRNHALPILLSKLDAEIEKGNNDADRLEEIKNALERATKTVDELKDLVDALTDTDATIKSTLEALIQSAGNISTTFMPDNA